MKNPHSVFKLEEFFKEVARLTLNHEVCCDNAMVRANTLGEALSKVDPEWWTAVNKPVVDASARLTGV